MQQGRYIAHKFESGWEVGVIKAFTFDKKGPQFPSRWQVQREVHMIQTGGRTLFCVRVMEKTSTGFCWGSRAVIPLEVTIAILMLYPPEARFFVLLFY
jgi:hypothetical protein